MTKLHQLLPINKGRTTEGNEALTRAHHDFARTPLLSGLTRNYAPHDDEGEKLPGESQLVQVKSADILSRLTKQLTTMFSTQLTVDTTNRHAIADVIVDGQTLLTNVPATYLLWLEKKLVDLRTFIQNIPVLDPAEEWTFDTHLGVWRSAPKQTLRAKKVLRNHVKAPATDKFPAQVDVYHEDVAVGVWTTVKFSGAMPATDVAKMRARVVKLQEAVKMAREQANSVDVTDQGAGLVLDYVFDGF